MQVLVTGGTGFVGGWCIATALERGHQVRTTVRSEAGEARLRAQFPDAGRGLDIRIADLTADAGWAEAAAGVDAVLHVASPMGDGVEPTDPDELIVPARDGTLRVLRAAIAAGVPRVVMTSSGAAATPSPGSVGEFDESLWTNPDQPGLDSYRRSKAIAERAAWDLMATAGGSTTLATVLPGAIFGPIRTGGTSGSVEVIAQLLRGSVGVPRIGLQVVDVRDLADLHLRAMTDPVAAGRRFLAVSGFIWMREITALLHQELGEAGRRAARRELPDWAVRALSRIQPGLAPLVPMLGRRYTYSTAAARDLLGWEPRPVAETVLDTARALVATGRA